MAATSGHSRTLASSAAAFLAALACLIVAAPAALATPGAQLWVSPNGPGNGIESAEALAVSPDGSKVFVTGTRGPPVGTPVGGDFATVAYDPSTGALLWAKRYNGTANRFDRSQDLAVSPDGTKVFVTGTSEGRTNSKLTDDYVTIAYNASTGAQLWVRRFNGPANGDDGSFAVGVSPNGSKVFVTGVSKWSTDPRFGDDYATVAYDAGSGARLWVQRYKNGPGSYDDSAYELGLSPDGSKVFVAGFSEGLTNSKITHDYATVAYNASSGAQLWVRRYNGPSNSDDRPGALGVSPGGARVFVTGRSFDGYSTTVAYNASSGAPLWVKRKNGHSASALGVSPNGSKLFVTGNGAGAAGQDYATVAYSASTGAALWARGYNGTGNLDDIPYALGVSPDGSQVFVTGYSWEVTSSSSSFDYATIAHNASTGAALWARRYDDGEDFANALGVSTDGSKLFVTGGSATVAYSIP